jgi:hypothetical protein
MEDTILKLEEAAYFLNAMKQHAQDFRLCAFNASAFASAARSVTLVMQVEYSHDKEFKKWYKNKQDGMKPDPDFSFFNDQRIKTIHKTPMKPMGVIGMGPFTFSGNGVVDIPIGTVSERGGIIPSQDWITVDGVPHPEIEKPPLFQYFVFEDKKDESAVDLCSRYFAKLSAIVSEWKGLARGTEQKGKDTTTG